MSAPNTHLASKLLLVPDAFLNAKLQQLLFLNLHSGFRKMECRSPTAAFFCVIRRTRHFISKIWKTGALMQRSLPSMFFFYRTFWNVSLDPDRLHLPKIYVIFFGRGDGHWDRGPIGASQTSPRKDAVALQSATPCDLTALSPNSLFLRSMQNENRLMKMLKTSNKGREILLI